MRLVKLYLCIISVFLSLVAHSKSLLHTPHCLSACPIKSEISGETVVREIYTLQNNNNTKFADWIAYKVEHKNFGKTKKRNWKKDPDLQPENTLGKEDYKNANESLGVDRGHLAPLSTFSGNEYWFHTNFLSNITPQDSKLNRGIWKQLESKIRKVSLSNDQTLYVITGTLYGNNKMALPNSSLEHEILDEFYKIISLPTENGIEYVSFKIPQSFTDTDFYRHRLL